MRGLARRSPLVLVILFLLANFVVATGMKGEGIAAGCFARPVFAHDRGLPHLHDVVVFATAAPDTLQIYSVAQAHVTNTLKAADRLQDMALSPYDPQGNPNPYAYVVTKTGRIASYDLGHNAMVNEVKLSDDPDATSASVAVSGDGKMVAVGVGDQLFQIRDIAILDASDLSRRLHTINIGGDLQGIVANPNPDIHEIYLINDRAAKVRTFNLDTLTLSGDNMDLTGSPSHFAVAPGGSLAMASINARNKVVFIDLRTKRLFYEISLTDASPHRIIFDPTAPIAYITDRRPRGGLYRIDLKPILAGLETGNYAGIKQEEIVSRKAMPSMLAENGYIPESAGISSDGRFLYLAGSSQTRFSVVNLAPIPEIQQLNPRGYAFMTDLASQQQAGTAEDQRDGMYEIQGVNLAKDPVTFGLLYNSNLVFQFTSDQGKKGATE